MKRLVVMMVAAGAAVAAVAMPTKAELQKAQEMVSDVTAADVAALKAKTKKPAEVAAKHMELAGQAGSEAEKYLLLQAAFKLYAKAGDYDAAANVIEKLQTEITDYDPEVTVELCGAEFIRKMRENAPRLYALKENARRIVFYRKQLPIREAAVKKNPKDAQAQRKLAECHAELGDWPKALDVFVKAGGELKKMVEGETSGKVPAQELGDFWWGYETKSDTLVYKLHAAELYRKAIADDSFKGLARTRAEQRVKEVSGDVAAVAADGQGVSPRAPAATGLYCVIDLSGGPDAKKYPVSYLNDVPKGGWSDEYKTTKLVLRRIEPGKPVLVGRGSEQRRTSVSEPYYLGVFEVTQGQWEQVMGTRPSFWRGKDYKKRPVECVSYDLLRGKINGGAWPRSNEVDPGSFMGCVREKSGKAFDLPTDKQWEYACAAGCEADYNNGGMCANGMKNTAMDAVGRYKFNGGWNEEKWGKFSWDVLWKSVDRECDTRSGTAAVGSYEPNKWGFYDMHGNVWEWCLDMDSEHDGERILRCSWWLDLADQCRTSVRKHGKPNVGSVMHGFRLCLPLAGGAAVPVANNSTPKIVGVSPANGDQAIDAGVGEVVVRFDRPMQTGLSLTGFDWPKIAVGEPKWDETMTTLRVSVNLKPMATYRLGFNSRSHMNFRSKEGAPLAPYTHVFRTK